MINNIYNKEVNKWSDIPENWKLVKKPTKRKFKYDIKDDGLAKLLANAMSNETIRSAMYQTIMTHKNGVASSNAHILAFVKFENDYEPRKSYSVKDKKWLDEIAPDLEAVVPSFNIRDFEKVDVLKLKTYCQAMMNGEYLNSKTNAIVFKNDKFKKGKVRFNAKFIIIMCDFFLQQGIRNVYYSQEEYSRPSIFTVDRNTGFEETLFLCMPIFVDEDSSLGAMDIDMENICNVYFDITKNEIYNSDGTVADFDEKLIKPSLVVNTLSSDVIKKIGNILNKPKPVLPILENVLIRENKLYISDLRINFCVKINDKIQDGIYSIVNGVFRYEEDIPINDYPLLNINPPENKTGTCDIRKVVKAIIYGKLFSSEDDLLRPALQGVNLKLIDNKDFLIQSADGYVLSSFKLNNAFDITNTDSLGEKLNEDTIVCGYDKKNIEFYKLFEQILKEVDTTDKFDLYIQNDRYVTFKSNELIFNERLVDERYPNFEGQIEPFEQEFTTYEVDIKAILESDKVKNYVKKAKKQNTSYSFGANEYKLQIKEIDSPKVLDTIEDTIKGVEKKTYTPTLNNYFFVMGVGGYKDKFSLSEVTIKSLTQIFNSEILKSLSLKTIDFYVRGNKQLITYDNNTVADIIDDLVANENKPTRRRKPRKPTQEPITPVTNEEIKPTMTDITPINEINTIEKIKISYPDFKLKIQELSEKSDKETRLTLVRAHQTLEMLSDKYTDYEKEVDYLKIVAFCNVLNDAYFNSAYNIIVNKIKDDYVYDFSTKTNIVGTRENDIFNVLITYFDLDEKEIILPTNEANVSTLAVTKYDYIKIENTISLILDFSESYFVKIKDRFGNEIQEHYIKHQNWEKLLESIKRIIKEQTTTRTSVSVVEPTPSEITPIVEPEDDFTVFEEVSDNEDPIQDQDEAKTDEEDDDDDSEDLLGSIDDFLNSDW